MKTFFTCLLIGCFLTLPSSTVSYESEEPPGEPYFVALAVPPDFVPPPKPPPKPVKAPTSDLIALYANKYNVSENTMHKVVKCESKYRNIQSQIPKVGGPNGREDSWGIVQIHLPSHPKIKKSQALDLNFAIDFLAKNLAKGKGNMWTCYRNLL